MAFCSSSACLARKRSLTDWSALAISTSSPTGASLSTKLLSEGSSSSESPASFAFLFTRSSCFSLSEPSSASRSKNRLAALFFAFFLALRLCFSVSTASTTCDDDFWGFFVVVFCYTTTAGIPHKVDYWREEACEVTELAFREIIDY